MESWKFAINNDPGMSGLWARWGLVHIRKEGVCWSRDYRRAKGGRNLESTRTHMELFRKKGAKNRNVYAGNTGNSRGMGLCFEENSFNLKLCSLYETGILFSQSKHPKEMPLLGLVDNHWDKEQRCCSLKFLDLWSFLLPLLYVCNFELLFLYMRISQSTILTPPAIRITF